jgi:rubrerythrin
LLVAIHHRENVDHAASEWIEFWLSEARSPELIQDLCRRFPAEAVILQATRPLLQLALADDLEPLRAALDAEVRAEQAKDRAYWEPLRREMEQFRREEREQGVC